MAVDEQLKAEIDLSQRILKYRILEEEALAKSWNWLDDDRRTTLDAEYQNIMSPFVQQYGKTDYAVRVAMQCGALRL